MNNKNRNHEGFFGVLKYLKKPFLVQSKGGNSMCESAAYILKEDGIERIMDNVVSVDPFEGKVYLTDLLGEQKIIDGEIKEIRLMDHKIIIKENKR